MKYEEPKITQKVDLEGELGRNHPPKPGRGSGVYES